MAALVETALRAGAKLVLVGDPDQLQPIAAGAAFRAIGDRIGYAELETIYRQKEGWMRTASLDLARGRVEAALSAYKAQGRVIGKALKAEAIESLIASWNLEFDANKSSLILAHLRRDVRHLNQLAREKLVERGVVGNGHAFRTEEGTRHFDAGDQIVFLRNDSALGVKNGMLAKVVEVAPGRIVAEIGEGESRRRVEITERVYSNVDLGYAIALNIATQRWDIGQQIDISMTVAIDGTRLAHSDVRRTDAEGRQLPVFAGGVVPSGQVFLHSDFAGSYDSRYFGPIPDTGLLGLAEPVLTLAP